MLDQLCGPPGIQGLRAPLHVALGVSPMLLFLDTLLHRKAVNRRRILEVRLQYMPLCGSAITQALWQTELAGAGLPQTLYSADNRTRSMENII